MFGDNALQVPIRMRENEKVHVTYTKRLKKGGNKQPTNFKT